jgi:archaellum biogenesis ATPase FlaH
MNVTPRTGTKERTILIGMITDKTVLGAIAARWKPPGAFGGVWQNLVGGWAVSHYQRVLDAPGRSIEVSFCSWAEDHEVDQHVHDAIERFLQSLSEEWENTARMESTTIIEMARDLFARVSLDQLVGRVSALSDAGKIVEAEQAVAEFSRFDLGSKCGTDLFIDVESVRRVFAQSQTEDVLTFRGGAGKFFTNTLTRASFVAIVAPEKKGKSFLLQRLAFQAVLQRKRVALFEAGDQTEAQLGMRWMELVSKRPRRPALLRIPISLSLALDDKNDRRVASVGYKTVEYKEPLDVEIAWEACQRLMQDKVKSKQSYYRQVIYPNSTLSIKQIHGILQMWQDDGWTADVVVIDYMDILAPPDSAKKQEYRHQIDATWREARRLSQDWQCLLLTATQCDRKGYGQYILTMENLSEDKRKLSHATAIMGLTNTHKEDEMDVLRINWIENRMKKASVSRCLFIAGCRDISDMMILTEW